MLREMDSPETTIYVVVKKALSLKSAGSSDPFGRAAGAKEDRRATTEEAFGGQMPQATACTLV
jgi:hypothetical protein